MSTAMNKSVSFVNPDRTLTVIQFPPDELSDELTNDYFHNVAVQHFEKYEALYNTMIQKLAQLSPCSDELIERILSRDNVINQIHGITLDYFNFLDVFADLWSDLIDYFAARLAISDCTFSDCFS